MSILFDLVVWRVADNVAEGDEELNEQAGRIGFGVRLKRSDKIASKAEIGGLIHCRPLLRGGTVGLCRLIAETIEHVFEYCRQRHLFSPLEILLDCCALLRRMA